MISTLLIADLHLTDLLKDEYRWDIFPWLLKITEEYEIKRLIVLGDLTDKKDKHSSKLANGLVSYFNALSQKVEEIIILKGNHDYVDEDSPFFKFLDIIDNIRFVMEPIRIRESLYLPHTRNPLEDWSEFLSEHGPGSKYIYMHQTVSGSIFANGYKFETSKAQEYNEILGTQKALVYSGDVHVPQEIDDITYVGSPYSVNYGDHWSGRAILLKDGKESNLEYDGPIKWCIDIRNIKELEKFISDNEVSGEVGDTVKIRIHLGRVDYHLYNDLKIQIKKILDRLGIGYTTEMKPIKGEIDKEVKIGSTDLKLTDKEVVKQFSKMEKLNQGMIDKALELIL